MPSRLECGLASRALPGEPLSGDVSVVRPIKDGVLVAAVDGIGHGKGASEAATVAASILGVNAAEPVTMLVQRCHEALRSTRGVTMSVASFDLSRGLVAWLGVGNVEGVLLRRGLPGTEAEVPLLLRSGVVGFQLPPLDVEVLPISPGDTLVFATDGIQSDFARGLARNLPPQRAAENILARHAKATDDALVVVARYLGKNVRR